MQVEGALQKTQSQSESIFAIFAFGRRPQSKACGAPKLVEMKKVSGVGLRTVLSIQFPTLFNAQNAANRWRSNNQCFLRRAGGCCHCDMGRVRKRERRILQRRALLQPRQSFASHPTNILECHFVRELVKEKARKRKMKGGKTAAFHTRCTQQRSASHQTQAHTHPTRSALPLTSSFSLRALFISGVRARIMPGRPIQFTSRAPTYFIYCRGTLKGAYSPPMCLCCGGDSRPCTSRTRQMQIFRSVAKF